jgi:hypothetical protein
MKEKRLEPRICTAFTAKCVELPERKNSFYTAICDLSPGGIQIFCDKPLPCGTNFNININLIHESIEARVQVAWNDKKANSDKFCAGLKFLEVNRKCKNKIENFIDTIYLNTIVYSCNLSGSANKKAGISRI